MSRSYARRPAQPHFPPRRIVQSLFLLLNVWIGLRFYLWVRAIETGATGPIPSRPPGVEGWLPIAGLMNLKYFALTGVVPDVHPAGMFLLIAFLAISLLFRKAFCSWLCPIGTLSEWLWEGGHELFGRTWTLPWWADRPLRALKYLLLALFAFVIVGMSADDARTFLSAPYGLVADVKMLNFFRHAGTITVGVCSMLVVLSIVTRNFWCRYLCPYGALLGLVSTCSPVRIARNPVSCIDCGKCAKACPSVIPVDVLRTVRTPECTACLSCIASCPVDDALELRVVRVERRLTPRAVAVGIGLVLVVVIGYAKTTNSWQGHVPEAYLRHLVPYADAIEH